MEGQFGLTPLSRPFAYVRNKTSRFTAWKPCRLIPSRLCAHARRNRSRSAWVPEENRCGRPERRRFAQALDRPKEPAEVRPLIRREVRFDDASDIVIDREITRPPPVEPVRIGFDRHGRHEGIGQASKGRSLLR